MELKKNPEHDLTKRRGLFFEIGLLIVLAGVLIAFEWKSYEGDAYDLGTLNLDDIEEEIIPITQQNLRYFGKSGKEQNNTSKDIGAII